MKFSTTLAILICLVLVHLAIVLCCLDPGYISADETLYHLSAQRFWEVVSAGGSPFSRAALSVPILTPQGELVNKYPYLTSIIAWPLYSLIGYRSLFIVNALAFWFSLYFLFKLANLYFSDKKIALLSSILFGFCSFAWEYSFGSWPHMLSVLFILAAQYFLVLGLEQRSSKHVCLAGLIFGFGLGVRYDVVLAVVAAFILIGIFKPAENVPRRLILFLLGLVPGIALLLFTNYLKFDEWNLFSYGGKYVSQSQRHEYIVLAIVIAVALVWVFQRTGLTKKLGAWLLFGLAIFGLAVFTEFRTFCINWFIGLYVLLVDLNRNLLPGSIPSTDSAMRYLSGIKRALLESCPYLAGLIWLFHFSISGAIKQKTSQLLILPVVFVVFYSASAWHGGQALNMRYFLPMLPFTAAILSYYLITYFSPSPRQLRRLVILSLFVILPLLIVLVDSNWMLEGYMLRLFPLLIVALILGLSIIYKRNLDSKSKLCLQYLIVLSCLWSGLSVWVHDFRLSKEARSATYSFGQNLVRHVPDGSVLVVSFYEPVTSLIEHKSVKYYRPWDFAFEGFNQIAGPEVCEMRPIFLAVSQTHFIDLARRGLINPTTTAKLYGSRDLSLYQVC